jgi:hypothetical protein
MIRVTANPTKHAPTTQHHKASFRNLRLFGGLREGAAPPEVNGWGTGALGSPFAHPVSGAAFLMDVGLLAGVGSALGAIPGI